MSRVNRASAYSALGNGVICGNQVCPQMSIIKMKIFNIRGTAMDRDDTVTMDTNFRYATIDTPRTRTARQRWAEQSSQ